MFGPKSPSLWSFVSQPQLTDADVGPRAVVLHSQTGFVFLTQGRQTGSQMFFDKSRHPLPDARPLTVTLMLERHKYSVLSTAQHPQPHTPHTPSPHPGDSHTHRCTRAQPSTPCSNMQKRSPSPTPRSPSSSDTAPRGPMSVELSRHSQNTQNLMVAETPRLHDTRLPGGSPFRGAGGGRRQPEQDSALRPSNSADSESGHLPLTEPQTLPCSPDPHPGLARDAPCQALLRAKSGEAPALTPGAPQSCAGPLPARQARGLRSGVLGWRGAAAGPVVIAWQPEARPTRTPTKL